MQQLELIAGDSLNFLTSVPGYPAGAGWVLKYRLVPRVVGATPIDIAATAEGDDFRVVIAAGTTAGWVPGLYTWASWVDKAGEIYSISGGQLSIKPDPRIVAAGYDGRTAAQQALEACESAMATFNATGGKVKKYEIAGRTMEFQTIGELLTLHSFWKARVMSEGTSQSIADGLGNPRNLFVRFVQPCR